MKKIIYVLCIASTLLYTSCNSCEGTDDSFRGHGGKSKSKELIDKNIDQLGEARWDKKNYQEIRDNQIASFKGTPNAKEALNEKLNNVYGKVLVKEGNLLMDNDCGSNHNRLSQVMAELKSFPNAENAGPLNARYKEHQEVLSFINTMYAKQAVRSYTDSYDRSFETRIKNQAAAYLKKDIKCAALKNKLNGTSAAFSARRRSFCESIVNLYCQKGSWNRGDENVLRSRLIDVNGRVESSWENRLDRFRESHSNN